MTIPLEPKIYHIVHVDRLPSILAEGGLLSDAAMQGRLEAGTEIGIPRIKQRRRHNQLRSHPGPLCWSMCAILLLASFCNAAQDPLG